MVTILELFPVSLLCLHGLRSMEHRALEQQPLTILKLTASPLQLPLSSSQFSRPVPSSALLRPTLSVTSLEESSSELRI